MLHVAQIRNRDKVEVEVNAKNEIQNVSIFGCSHFLKIINEYKNTHGKNISNWPEPTGNSHEHILIREIILKLKNQWDFPYKDLELCHCRKVPTEVVDQAIIAGAHSAEEVSRITGAGTACGTCRPNTESMIKYRIKT